jgi:hypothetical protein
MTSNIKNKMVLWDDIFESSSRECVKLPFSLEHKYFFNPLIETITSDLLADRIKGYSAGGKEPEMFSDPYKLPLITKKGPSGIIFRASELVNYIEKFEFSGKSYHEGVFSSAKASFLRAIERAHDQSWNMSLSEVFFTCNNSQIAQEVRENILPTRKLH